jgi:hypothetical protein
MKDLKYRLRKIIRATTNLVPTHRISIDCKNPSAVHFLAYSFLISAASKSCRRTRFFYEDIHRKMLNWTK